VHLENDFYIFFFLVKEISIQLSELLFYTKTNVHLENDSLWKHALVKEVGKYAQLPAQKLACKEMILHDRDWN